MRNYYFVRVLSALSLLLIVHIDQTRGACPNFCNGHGQCQSDNTCECEDSYDVVPDCSLRKSVEFSLLSSLISPQSFAHLDSLGLTKLMMKIMDTRWLNVQIREFVIGKRLV